MCCGPTQVAGDPASTGGKAARFGAFHSEQTVGALFAPHFLDVKSKGSHFYAISNRIMQLRDFVKQEKWTYAKTMPKWPHEYIVRERVDENLFIKLVQHIRINGYQGNFYRKTTTYYKEDGLVYWTMGAPIDETIIINRCKEENSYEYRLAHGALPE